MAAVIVLAKAARLGEEALAVDIAHMVGDFLDAGDLEALAHLDRADIFAGFQEILVGAGVLKLPAVPATRSTRQKCRMQMRDEGERGSSKPYPYMAESPRGSHWMGGTCRVSHG
jgi:hypothetical protein